MKQYELKNGEKLIIREAKKEDAQGLIDYVSQIGGESDFLTFGAGEFNIPLEAEEEIIENSRKTDNSLFLVAEIDGEIIASLNFNGGRRSRTRHMGEFGLSVIKKYWGMGIGTRLIEYMIDWAKETGFIRKINLKVRADHEKGIRLYHKLGFEKEGVTTRFFLHKGVFYDAVEMGLKID